MLAIIFNIIISTHHVRSFLLPFEPATPIERCDTVSGKLPRFSTSLVFSCSRCLDSDTFITSGMLPPYKTITNIIMSCQGPCAHEMRKQKKQIQRAATIVEIFGDEYGEKYVL
jgi:hypothetical protein